MSREEYVRCDVCGCTAHLREWVFIPFRRMLVFPRLFNKTGSAFFDVCGRVCEYTFREYCKHYFGEDVYYEHDKNKRHSVLRMDDRRAADNQAVTISQGIKGYKT
jgi:hypothetical protein